MTAPLPALLPGPDPSYRFLPGGEPYSSGVVATPGWEMVHATLQAPVPWRQGFAEIERHLRDLGRPRTALGAIELRIPSPLTFGGFAEFNRGLPRPPGGVGTSGGRAESDRTDQRGAPRGPSVRALAPCVLLHRGGPAGWPAGRPDVRGGRVRRAPGRGRPRAPASSGPTRPRPTRCGRRPPTSWP